ncbi:MAG TPA: SPOR domain-containing protein [Deltaproteobacteria bacterium]|nr:SPOR domain-containing protein [Deltaproteobacteria bacterium]HQI81007.1 SPOR domain-containing protein [Deltaproteobacteria bacterium]
MKHLILVVLFCLAAHPLWADYGLSNVVTRQIDRGQQPARMPMPVSGDMVVTPPAAPAQTPAQEPVQKAPEAAPVKFKKTVFYPYTVHISSWQNKKDALNYYRNKIQVMDQVFITKIDLGATGIWYRVDHGLFMSQKDASARLSDLQARGLVDAETFIGSAVPYAIEIGIFGDRASAAEEAARLNKNGIIPYIVKESDTVYRLLNGAYPGEKSAGPALEDLVAMGLKPRVTKR